MEKRKPTYDLAAFKRAAEKLGFSSTAFRDARALGFDRAGMSAVIKSMERRHFYKSMTAYKDHRVWQ